MEPEVLVRQGHTARLGCVVRGFPASRVSWFKDGNGKYVVSLSEGKSNTSTVARGEGRTGGSGGGRGAAESFSSGAGSQQH